MEIMEITGEKTYWKKKNDFKLFYYRLIYNLGVLLNP